MTPAPPIYTAAQIASALGVTASAVRQRLASVPATGNVRFRGQLTNAWSISALPASMQNELSALLNRRGCKSIGDLLADPPAPWQPPIEWHQISIAFRDLAQKLCAALAPVLARQHQLPGPELMTLAAALYRQNVGHEIQADKLRYLMDRATKRDNGFNQWQRPDIYLDDAAFHSAPADAGTKAGTENLHAPIDDSIKDIKDRDNPTLDRAFLFHAAFKHLEKLAVQHPSKSERRAAKNTLINYLYRNVPGLYRPQAVATAANTVKKPELALRGTFNRSYTDWVAGGRTVDSLRDGRADSCGRKGYACEKCDPIINAHAARLRGEQGKAGNLDLAIKMLTERNEICAKCAHHYASYRISDTARKRLTPNRLQVAAMKGSHEVRKIAPTHHTAWDTSPGDRFVIDDMTTNEMAWDDVSGEIISGQVQMLHTVDEFSDYPLPYLLYFGPPNSRTIKKEIALLLIHIGLPHIALLTERGVFANRQLAGERGIQNHLGFRELQDVMENYFQHEAVPDQLLSEIRQRDLGLRDPKFRLAISQARSPQAKTIERQFFEFQKSSSRLAGHGGFNQRNEMPRAMQDFQRRVKAGIEHPGNEWLHISDLRKNYDAIFAEIATRKVNGVRHRGLTPNDLWMQAVARKPLRKLPPEIEVQLSTHRLPSIKVRTQGICISLDKHEDAFYYNEYTGPLVGKFVAVRINYDIPEYIYLEQPKTGKLLKVDRVRTLRTTATKEELAKSNAARRAHINGALGEIGNVENRFTSWMIRDNQHSPADISDGAQIIADAAQHKEQQASAAREKKRIEHLAGTLGTSVPSNPQNLDRVREGLELEQQALAEIEAFEKAKGDTQS